MTRPTLPGFLATAAALAATTVGGIVGVHHIGVRPIVGGVVFSNPRWVLRATSIGVLLSATVPARAGEPARAFVMARNLGGGRARGSAPALLREGLGWRDLHRGGARWDRP